MALGDTVWPSWCQASGWVAQLQIPTSLTRCMGVLRATVGPAAPRKCSALPGTGHIWPLLAASRLSPCGPAELPAVRVCGVVSGEDQCQCRHVPIGHEALLLVLRSRPLSPYNCSQGEPRFTGQTARALDQFCLGFPTSSVFQFAAGMPWQALSAVTSSC